MKPRKPLTYSETVSAAIDDITDHGFDSVERVTYWSQQIEEAARRTFSSEKVLTKKLQDGLRAVYRKLVDRGEVAQHHSGIATFTLDKVRPELRAELDRRIMASAMLIRNNRAMRVAETLKRFEGWATSVPKGGAAPNQKAKIKSTVKPSLATLGFEERRVLIDQSHKLTAAINETVAKGGGAIALIWHSNWRQPNYNYREEHKERDGLVYLIRGSWAHEKGLVKPGEAGYYDKVTAVAEEPFCRCHAQYIYSLRRLPQDMVTAKGRQAMQDAEAAMSGGQRVHQQQFHTGQPTQDQTEAAGQRVMMQEFHTVR